jgi:hypothetical protein
VAQRRILHNWRQGAGSAKQRGHPGDGHGRGELADSFHLAAISDIISSLGDGVVANMEGRFVLFNPAAERILSLGLMDVPLSDWSKVYGCYRPDMVSAFPSDELPLARSLRGEVVDDCEIFIRRNGGPEGGWISVSSRPVTDEVGRIQGGVVTFRDVTARSSNSNATTSVQIVEKRPTPSPRQPGNIVYQRRSKLRPFSRTEVLGENHASSSPARAQPFYQEMARPVAR